MANSNGQRTVLLPIDNSEHSERAFNWYFQVERRENDKMMLAHFFVPPPLPAMSLYRYLNIGRMEADKLVITNIFVPPQLPTMSLYHAAVKATDEYQEALNNHLEQAKRLIAKYEEKCKALNVQCETHLESCQDSIGADIGKVARNSNASFIVIGSRGLSQVRRTILGSVSEYVVHHSRIPVIIVPPEHPVNPF